MIKALKVNIVEDTDDARRRLAALITADSRFILTAQASTMKEGLADLLREKPDLLLVDLGLPDGSGIDIIQQIHPNRLDTQALVISGFHDESSVFSALEAGALGYISKIEDDDNILDAINNMLKGGSPISPIIARLMLQRFKQPKVELELPEALTAKQLEILNYVAQGFTSKEISQKLGTSYFTITTHIKNIYGKLQVNSRTEAIYEAKKFGLL